MLTPVGASLCANPICPQKRATVGPLLMSNRKALAREIAARSNHASSRYRASVAAGRCLSLKSSSRPCAVA